MSIPQSSSCLRYFVVFLIQGLIAFLLFAYYKYSNNHSIVPAYSNAEPSNKPASNLIILLWTWPFGDAFPLNSCQKPFDNPQCFFTADRKYYNTANAVVLHHRDVCTSKQQIPQTPRPEGQYWVWFNLESPIHSPNLHFMDNAINLTMSYRSDSDIFTPYGWIEPNEDGDHFAIPPKSELVAWAVSNWNPHSRRVRLYEELKNHIQVDVFGNGHLPLARQDTLAILSKYKFYLAFENSIHKDYITEKLWANALMSGSVPIVLGPPRENYERFIPANSFIHVDDFPSAKELASYMHELDKNDTKYKQYFNWRTKFKPISKLDWSIQYCKACIALHRAPPYRSMPSLVAWYK
ncbi:4-galactosyl-N-acetylglucosaminide 3-alpha-L-fucosyltransferase FUT6-like [Hyperolius riggenbachi]|uniref:4-galactosyl-N-acetylglucosaminide 3-alpha-L-fucosyltransferase FUT6-like n=1 Tax=Hyperolius riggenbachi TaxID=752182 RepID=UPI0035A381FE